jgi:hypothetical protein
MSRFTTVTVAVLAALGSVDVMGTGPMTRADGLETQTESSRRESRSTTIRTGYEIDVRLQSSLSSATAQPEQRFEATTLVDVRRGPSVLIPAGSLVRGVVRDVRAAGRLRRTGNITLSFDQITINGRAHPIRAMATRVFESDGIRQEGGTAAAGGGAGGIVGGLLGGVRGALLGAVIGAGGAIAATEGKNIELPAGTILRIRFDSPLDLQT